MTSRGAFVANGRVKKINAKPISRSKRAGLIFPVGRVQRFLKNRNYAKQIRVVAAVHLAGVLEYLCSEILDAASNKAIQNGRIIIKPRHILLAIKHDYEIDQLLQNVTISQGGIVPRAIVYSVPRARIEKLANNTKNTSSQEY